MQVAAEVVGRSLRGGNGHAVDLHHVVEEEVVVAGDDSDGWTVVAPDQFDRSLLVDPLRSVQADAARPVMGARRPDHSQAPTVFAYSDGVAIRGV